MQFTYAAFPSQVGCLVTIIQTNLNSSSYHQHINLSYQIKYLCKQQIIYDRGGVSLKGKIYVLQRYTRGTRGAYILYMEQGKQWYLYSEIFFKP